MTAKYDQTTKNNFGILIENAVSVLNLTFDTIRQKYKDYPVCIMEYIEKDIYRKCFEIRFDCEQASLICRFDDDKLCNFAFIHTDNKDILKSIADYLSKNYTYNYLKCCWELSTCNIKIQEAANLDSEFFLSFYL